MRRVDRAVIPLDAVTELVHRVVRCPRHHTEFIVSVIEAWRRQVALAITLRNPGDGVDALSDAPGEHRRGRRAAEQE